MALNIRLVLYVLISLSVMGGFLQSLGLEGQGSIRAGSSIFLFNLASGGLIITTFLSDKNALHYKGLGFIFLAVGFAVAAIIGIPPLLIVCSLLLAILTESVRWKRFTWFPLEFFKPVEISRKFEQASLLCLSSGLVICAATVLNNEYLHLIHLEKLSLHMFYLGFSFPISLITFSYIFRRLEASSRPPSRNTLELCFWMLNLGVIFFFFFILFEVFPMQLVMALCLFTVVMISLYLHLRSPERDGAWCYVTSGISLLIAGSVTGIVYVVIEWINAGASYEPGYLVGLHSAATVYGWNLTWIMLAVRNGEKPPAIAPRYLIGLHWCFVLLIPLARTSLAFAITASLMCLVLLGIKFFYPDSEHSSSPSAA